MIDTRPTVISVGLVFFLGHTSRRHTESRFLTNDFGETGNPATDVYPLSWRL